MQSVANAGNKKTKFKTIPSHESLPAPLVDLAVQLKNSIQIPVVAIGKINGPELADQIIEQGKANFVIMATNVRSNNCLLQELGSKVKKNIAIGDAADPGNIGSAIRSATKEALKI